MQAQLEREKKSETIKFAYEVIKETDNVFYRIRKKFGKDTINIDDQRYDDELKEEIRQYLGRMERFAVGINTEVYDIDLFARMCRHKAING